MIIAQAYVCAHVCVCVLCVRVCLCELGERVHGEASRRHVGMEGQAGLVVQAALGQVRHIAGCAAAGCVVVDGVGERDVVRVAHLMCIGQRHQRDVRRVE